MIPIRDTLNYRWVVSLVREQRFHEAREYLRDVWGLGLMEAGDLVKKEKELQDCIPSGC